MSPESLTLTRKKPVNQVFITTVCHHNLFRLCNRLIIILLVTAASFTATSSYQTDSNSFISNAIPDSTGDTQGFNYQYSKQYQFNNQYQYQYQQPASSDSYYQTQTSTFRPLLSLFKTAANLFTKPKPQIRIGTYYV